MMANSGGECMTKVVSLALCESAVFEGAKDLEFHHDQGLHKVLKDVPNDCKVYTISVSGAFRNGKSFLINSLATYLEHTVCEGKSSWSWETCRKPITGVNWKCSRKGVTSGIWMWYKPFMMKTGSGEEVAVLLVDCQGTNDPGKSDTQLNFNLDYLSFQMADLQIINFHERISARDIEALQLCSTFSKLSKKNVTPFGDLMILVRDWKKSYLPSFGSNKDYFANEFLCESESRETKRNAQGIVNSFGVTNTYMLPKPSEKVDEASVDKDGGLIVKADELGADFTRYMRKFFEEILEPTYISKKALRRKWQVTYQFESLEESLKSLISEGPVPSHIDAAHDIMIHNRALTPALAVVVEFAQHHTSLMVKIKPIGSSKASIDHPADFNAAKARAEEIFNEGYCETLDITPYELEHKKSTDRLYRKYHRQLQEQISLVEQAMKGKDLVHKIVLITTGTLTVAGAVAGGAALIAGLAAGGVVVLPAVAIADVSMKSVAVGFGLVSGAMKLGAAVEAAVYTKKDKKVNTTDHLAMAPMRKDKDA